MGEVYRARDTKLGRDVALKVLPDAFSRDAERLARFEREAHLLASLNHSGIAAIHGIEESDGIRFLVLELVPGETLAERLRAGALRLPEALDIARQIAAALAAAHDHGIIHRDLKPANIQLTGKGVVKLLDFGLAKGLESGALPSALSQSPTLSVAGTRDGVILGTAPYMSPEQARGEELDKRTDVWSFGSVLYEALSGRRAFTGATVSDTIAAILEREPDWQALPASTPASIRSLLRRCLHKDKNRRLREIADAQLEIEEVQSAGVSGASAETPPPPARSRPAWVATALAGLVLAVVGVGWNAWTRTRGVARAPHQATRLNINLPSAAGFTTDVEGNDIGALAISPDGRHIVYMSESGGRRQLYLRDLDRLDPTAIVGTEGGYNPFFSPDGHWLGFAADGKLKKVPLRGDAPTVLCDAPAVRGASWGPDGTILFGLFTGGLFRVTAAGGTPQVATTPDTQRGEALHAWPQILPDGKAALFSIRTGRHERIDEARIAVLSLETGRWKDVLTGDVYPRYVSSGHLLYWRSGSLFAAPFSLDRLATVGGPAPVLEGVGGHVGPGAAYAEVAGSGSLVYLTGEADRAVNGTLVWVDRHGKVEPITGEQKAYGEPALSLDGRRLAVTIEEPPDTRDLWVLDLGRETWTRVTSGEATRLPVWSPEGDQIVFASDRNGYFSPFRARADGTGSMEPLLQCTDSLCSPTSQSPDGKTLAFSKFAPGRGADVWILPLDGERAPRPLVATKAWEGRAWFSADGAWIAYTSDETGRKEIFVRPFPKDDQRWQISKGADSLAWPVWSRSGREIFYLSEGRMMSVPVRTAPGFTSGTPQALFEWSFDPQFDVSPDGHHFVAIERSRKPPAPPQLVVVPDFLDELRARLRPSR